MTALLIITGNASSESLRSINQRLVKIESLSNDTDRYDEIGTVLYLIEQAIRHRKSGKSLRLVELDKDQT